MIFINSQSVNGNALTNNKHKCLSMTASMWIFWLHPCINRVNKFNLPPQKDETVTQKAGHEPVEPSEPFKGTPPWEGALHNVLYR